MRFSLSHIDDISFWLGIIVASIFWWIVMALRPILDQIGETIRARQAEAKEKARASSAIEEHYRRKVLTQAQGWHLASSLFSLDEIIQPPLLLAPPPRIEPGSPLYLEDITETAVPYLPAWPELAGIYYAPTLTLAQALSGNSDIVLTGQPGMGKTVALAHLASCLARRESGLGLPEDTLPFLMHVADLNLPIKRDESLNPIIEFISNQAAVFDVAHIPDMVRGAFEDGRALVLLDGTDELTPEALKEVVEFIKSIKRSYPKTRMVTTSSPEYLDGLVSLNFIPFSLAAWTPDQRMKFLERWSDLWNRYVATETWAQVAGPSHIDPLLVNNWLITDSLYLTPLELTLEAWGAYAGDTRGPRPIDALETHLRRLTPANSPREALEMLALQLDLATEPIFDPHQARDWIKSFEPPEPVAVPESSEGNKGKKAKKQQKQQAPSLGLISKMVDSGLLTQHRNNRMRFSHPVFGGYLAGRALINYKPESLLEQPPWIGKFLSMQYFAAHGDASSLATALLAKPDRPLSRNLLTIARWLRDSPRQAPWRGRVMSKMVELLKHEGQPLGLRGQALAAFVQSGDPSIASLLRQLLTEQSGELLQLVALGCGALQDVKAAKDLAGLLANMSPTVRRAACLALVNIGTAEALDTVGAVLLHGDEDSRKAAAEALANHPGEGHAMLREGALMKDDLMVRRAAAYGLGRISQPWAEELLAKMQVEDDQWAVRNAAVEIVEFHLHPNPSIPKHLPIPSESPWLIAYAGKQGLGISPDKTPIDLLLGALKAGTEEERLGALTYLRMMPMEGVFGALYQAMYSGETYLREAAYQTIFEMAARGVELPDPVQFGFGV
jgi:HEAT repeat protein